MPEITSLEEMPRRNLHIFYILDTSGSMVGKPIAMLNSAMEETVNILKEQAKSNADASLKIAVLEYNSKADWVNPAGPEDIEDFLWKELKVGGLTQIGEALTELDSKLSKDAFLKSMTGAYLPILIFMTDGMPTDDYKKALEQIQENKWFRRATKIGFAIGEHADAKMIAEIVGNPEAVVKTDDLELFARMIRFASVTSSMVCSTSRTSADPVTGADIVKQIADEEEEDIEALVDTSIVIDTPAAPEDDSEDEWEDDDWD